MRRAGLILLGLTSVCSIPAGASGLPGDSPVSSPGGSPPSGSPLSSSSGSPPSGNPLSSPSDFSLAPAPASSSALTGPLAGYLPGASPGFVHGGLVAGGVVSQSFGSGGMRSSAIEMDSGLIGGNTHAFVQMATGQGPRYHDAPTVNARSVAVGVETQLPYGFTVGIVGGADQYNLGRGRGISSLP